MKGKMNNNSIYENFKLIEKALGNNTSRLQELFDIQQELINLQDKLSRRNMQIKDLKEQVKDLKSVLEENNISYR